MQLETVESPAIMQLIGQQSGIVVLAGQRLTIETSPGGAEILDIEIPAAEQWVVNISVDVRVTGAV